MTIATRLLVSPETWRISLAAWEWKWKNIELSSKANMIWVLVTLMRWLISQKMAIQDKLTKWSTFVAQTTHSQFRTEIILFLFLGMMENSQHTPEPFILQTHHTPHLSDNTVTELLLSLLPLPSSLPLPLYLIENRNNILGIKLRNFHKGYNNQSVIFQL